MPVCPYCKKEVNFLFTEFVTEEGSAFFYAYVEDDDIYYDYTGTSHPPGLRVLMYMPDIKTKYYCPECHELPFNKEENARKFLVGKGR
jgi:hypothetical protein